MLFWIILVLTVWFSAIFIVLLVSTMKDIDDEWRESKEEFDKAMQKFKKDEIDLK